MATHMLPKILSRYFLLLGAAWLSLSTAQTLAADDYPSRPIRLVVNTGAGGVTDLLARYVVDNLRGPLGQSIIVDNRPGASGIIGAQIVAKATPDGYTLLMVFPSFTINPSLFDKLPYDTLKDFAPITNVGASVNTLLVNESFPAKTVKELISLAKERPGKLNYGSVGPGSLGYLASELLTSLTNVKVVHVPYKSAPQTLTALLSGEIQFYFNVVITAVPLIKSGKVRALGVSSKSRNSALPDIPTIEEAGIPGFEVVGTNGILAPAKVPVSLIARLNKEIVKVLQSPQTTKQFALQGVEPGGKSPKEYRVMIKAEIEKFAKVNKKASQEDRR